MKRIGAGRRGSGEERERSRAGRIGAEWDQSFYRGIVCRYRYTDMWPGPVLKSPERCERRLLGSSAGGAAPGDVDRAEAERGGVGAGWGGAPQSPTPHFRSRCHSRSRRYIVSAQNYKTFLRIISSGHGRPTWSANLVGHYLSLGKRASGSRASGNRAPGGGCEVAADGARARPRRRRGGQWDRADVRERGEDVGLLDQRVHGAEAL